MLVRQVGQQELEVGVQALLADRVVQQELQQDLRGAGAQTGCEFAGRGSGSSVSAPGCMSVGEHLESNCDAARVRNACVVHTSTYG